MRVASMRTAKGVKGRSLWLALVLGLALVPGWAQPPASGRTQTILSSGELTPELWQGGARGEVLREIDDPHTGERWLLIRNGENPGGPGHLVRITAGGHRFAGALPAHAEEAAQPPIIRSGDRLRIEEHTAVVDAVLEARAVTPAAAGAVFNARLTIGGKVVRAVALGPGRAAFQRETGVRP